MLPWILPEELQNTLGRVRCWCGWRRARTAEVAETGSLTAVGGDSSERGGYGIRSGLLHLTNNGTVRAASGKTKDAYSV